MTNTRPAANLGAGTISMGDFIELSSIAPSAIFRLVPRRVAPDVNNVVEAIISTSVLTGAADPQRYLP